jgi:hypothetical protein
LQRSSRRHISGVKLEPASSQRCIALPRRLGNDSKTSCHGDALVSKGAMLCKRLADGSFLVAVIPRGDYLVSIREPAVSGRGGGPAFEVTGAYSWPWPGCVGVASSSRSAHTSAPGRLNTRASGSPSRASPCPYSMPRAKVAVTRGSVQPREGAPGQARAARAGVLSLRSSPRPPSPRRPFTRASRARMRPRIVAPWMT